MAAKTEFFGLLESEQQLVLKQTAERLGLPVQAVEKDLWVSCVLQILFDSPFANALVFKGGTYPEPRRIFIRYRSLFEVNPYLQAQVLLEVGARSLMEPAAFQKVHCFVTETFPQFVLPLDIEVNTVVPQKTFLEKAFLLHEIFSGNASMAAERKSRHLYDLEKMMDTEHGVQAIANKALWEEIRHHRELFTSVSGVDYSFDIRQNIQLVPPQKVLSEWKADYEQMQFSMLHGTSLSFEKLLDRMSVLQQRFLENSL